MCDCITLLIVGHFCTASGVLNHLCNAVLVACKIDGVFFDCCNRIDEGAAAGDCTVT